MSYEFEYKTIKIKVPTNRIDNKTHNRNFKWSSLYFLKRLDQDRELICYENENDVDFVATSVISYKHNNLYKVASLSKKDGIFDYYKVLKINTPKSVGQISYRSKTTKELKSVREKNNYVFKKINKKEPYILDFS